MAGARACYSIRSVMLEQLFNLPAPARRILLVAGDTLAVLVAVWASFALRLGDWWPDMLQDVVWLFPLAVIVLIPTFTTVGLYRPILRYADESLLYTIVLGVSAGILLMMAVWVFLREGLVPRSSWLIGWLVLVALVGGGDCCSAAICVGGFGRALRGRRLSSTARARPEPSWPTLCATAPNSLPLPSWTITPNSGGAWCSASRCGRHSSCRGW